MLITIWNIVQEDPGDGDADLLQERGQHLKNKIIAMGKMARIFKTLREENESVVVLKGLAGGQVPVGILQQGPEAVKQSICTFQGARSMDRGNEKRPTFSAN